MKNGCRRLALSVAILIPLAGCFGPPSPWNGTWRLDQSKSSIPGPSFTLSTPSAGEYRFAIDDIAYNFRCDGKDYPIPANGRISCMQTSAAALDTTMKRSGSTQSISAWEVSSDGKFLTIKWNAKLENGSTRAVEKVYERLTGTNGFAGDWRDTKRLESRPQFLITRRQWQSMYLSYPQARQFTNAPLDGSDAAIQSPATAPGFTMSVKANGPREFLTTYKHSGQIYRQGTLQLADDGQTLLDSTWRPENPSEKTVLTYVKRPFGRPF